MKMEEERTRTKRIWRAGTLTYTTGGLVMLAVWMLWGDFPWALKDRAVVPAATVLIKQIGVSELVFSLIVLTFPCITNILIAPIISYVSDRHRGRLGRRIPFLLFTTPFIVVGLYLLGFTNLFGEWLHEAIPSLSEHGAKLIFFCFGWVFLDFGTTLSFFLFTALANDVVPKELLGRFFALFRIVSLGSGMLFNYWLFHKVATHAQEIFLGIGTLYGIGLFSMCFLVKEGEYPPPEKVEIRPGRNGRTSVFRHVMGALVTYLRQSFSIPYYRWIMLGMALSALSFVPINSYSIQYADALGVPHRSYGIYLVVTYTFSLVFSFPLGALADRFHPIRTVFASLVLYAILMIAGWIMTAFPLKEIAIPTGLPIGEDGAPYTFRVTFFGLIFVLHGIVSGAYFTLSASLTARLFPRQLFAQFSSAAGIVDSFCKGVLPPVLGLMIDATLSYRLVFPFGLVITLIGIVSIVVVYRYYQAYGGDEHYEAPMPK